MAGRPTSEALAAARLMGDATYEGAVHEECGTTRRYTKSSGCVQCARLRSAARMRRLAKAAKQLDKQKEPWE